MSAFIQVANEIGQWVWQHPILDVDAVIGVTLGSMAYKEHRARRKEEKKVEKMVDDFCNRPDQRIKLSPHSPRT